MRSFTALETPMRLSLRSLSIIAALSLSKVTVVVTDVITAYICCNLNTVMRSEVAQGASLVGCSSTARKGDAVATYRACMDS